MNDPPTAPSPAPGSPDQRGEGALSPLSGSYLLIIISEPMHESHKEIILNKITKGFLSWDEEKAHVDIHKELQTIAELNLEGEEQKGGERLIQYATENLVAEVLIHPQINTLQQCLRNLLSSFTKHRHIIHAGYQFVGSGSWLLQDGTFSVADLIAAFSEYDVQRVLHAYENCITIDIHCASEGPWTTQTLADESFSKLCRVTVSPEDKIETTSGISNFIIYLSNFLVMHPTESLLEPSDIVGNIRFSRPTLYVFPGGQGDSALFGVNGFNMLVDGGYNYKACFWDFTRHLDRLDAVLVTRLNSSNTMGIANVMRRKAVEQVYPQIGHIFCNVAGTQKSPDGDKDKDPLLVNLWDEGHLLRENLRQVSLKPHLCFRDNSMEPINLYHKVGHGKLDMYVINPSRDSKEVREFMQRWNNEVIASDQGFSTYKIGNKVFPCPLTNITSICALLIWHPNDPNDTITRILFPGSTPQHKIFEGLEKLRNLECLKHPVCSTKSLKSIAEERKSKAAERASSEKLMPESRPFKTVSPSPPVHQKLRKTRADRSISREEKRRLRMERQQKAEKTISETRKEKIERKIERRISRKEEKRDDKLEEKVKSELEETKEKNDTNIRQERDNKEITVSRTEIESNLSKKKVAEIYSEKQDIKIKSGLIEDSSEDRLSKLDQEIISTDVKDSSLVSVESGVVTGDDRESSLEIEQVEKMRAKPQRKEIDALSDASGSSEKRKSPRGVGRQSPRSIGRQSPRSIGRKSPRSIGRQSPRSIGRQSPRSIGRQSPSSTGRQSPRSTGRPTSSERIRKYRRPKVSSRIDIGRTERKPKVDTTGKTERKTKKERSLERKERKVKREASEKRKEATSMVERKERKTRRAVTETTKDEGETDKKEIKDKKVKKIKKAEEKEDEADATKKISEASEIKRRVKKTTSTEKDDESKVSKVTAAKSTKVEKRAVSKITQEVSHKKLAEEKNRAAKAAEIAKKEVKTTTAKTTVSKTAAKKPTTTTKPIRPKKDEKSRKSEAPVRKIISGATIKAGVVAAAVSGVAVIGAAGERDDADEMAGTIKEDALLAPDHDEEDRVSDIANIPGVQEIKIEDETRQIIEKQQLEEEEKDSLILHEEGVIEHVEKEDVIKEEKEDERDEEEKDKEEFKKDKEEDVKDEKEKESEEEIEEEKLEKKSMKKDEKVKVELESKLTEDFVKEEKLDIQVTKKEVMHKEKEEELEKEEDIEEKIEEEDEEEEEEEKVSIEEKHDGDEKEIKEGKVIEKADFAKDDKQEVDDQDEKMETDDAYATLPSSAKLTDYKDKYEDRPLRGIFTGFGIAQEPVKPISAKPKDEFPVPSSLPEAIFKPTAPPAHPREIIKTPDEVDDLPIHEEVESAEHEHYDQTTKSQKLDVTSPTIEVKGKLQMKEEVLPEKHEREDVKESKEKKDKEDKEDKEDKDKMKKAKTDDKEKDKKDISEKDKDTKERVDEKDKETKEEEISREEKVSQTKIEFEAKYAEFEAATVKVSGSKPSTVKDSPDQVEKIELLKDLTKTLEDKAKPLLKDIEKPSEDVDIVEEEVSKQMKDIKKSRMTTGYEEVEDHILIQQETEKIETEEESMEIKEKEITETMEKEEFIKTETIQEKLVEMKKTAAKIQTTSKKVISSISTSSTKEVKEDFTSDEQQGVIDTKDGPVYKRSIPSDEYEEALDKRKEVSTVTQFISDEQQGMINKELLILKKDDYEEAVEKRKEETAVSQFTSDKQQEVIDTEEGPIYKQSIPSDEHEKALDKREELPSISPRSDAYDNASSISEFPRKEKSYKKSIESKEHTKDVIDSARSISPKSDASFIKSVSTKEEFLKSSETQDAIMTSPKSDISTKKSDSYDATKEFSKDSEKTSFKDYKETSSPPPSPEKIISKEHLSSISTTLSSSQAEESSSLQISKEFKESSSTEKSSTVSSHALLSKSISMQESKEATTKDISKS
ncbi:unnamed protein product, partial [Meganyctiphanes norvegica]